MEPHEKSSLKPGEALTSTNSDCGLFPHFDTIWIWTNVDAEEVLKPTTAASPNNLTEPLTFRSDEMPPLNTYNDPSVAAPWGCRSALTPGSSSYHRTWLPAPPATVCCVQTARD